MNFDSTTHIIGFVPVASFVISMVHIIKVCAGKSPTGVNTTVSVFLVSTALCSFVAWMVGLSKSSDFSFFGILIFVWLNVVVNSFIIFLLFWTLKSPKYNLKFFLDVPSTDARKNIIKMALFLVVALPISYFLLHISYTPAACESSRCKSAMLALGSRTSGPTLVWIYCLVISPAIIKLLVNSTILLLQKSKNNNSKE